MKETVKERNNSLAFIVFENVEIKEMLDKVESKLKKQGEKTEAAFEQSNYNVQFSRQK